MERTWKFTGGPFMNELVYFSSADLMVEVSFRKYLNSIHYYSHRELSPEERNVVEQYLLTNLLRQAQLDKGLSPGLSYSGVDENLAKKLSRYHEKKRDAVAADCVSDLIAQAMSNYYFEKIGDTLVEIRRQSASPDQGMSTHALTGKLRELVEAYNVHAVTKVSFDDIVSQDMSGTIAV